MGNLTIENAYSSPFHASCSKCNYRFESYGTLNAEKGYGNRCNEHVSYKYLLYLKAIITNDNQQPVHCSIENNIVQQLLLALTNINYQQNIDDKSEVIFML